MKRKIGVCLVIAALLSAALLYFAGAPLVAKVREVHTTGTATMVDNSWQIRWHAFPHTGLLVGGIVMIGLSFCEKKS